LNRPISGVTKFSLTKFSFRFFIRSGVAVLRVLGSAHHRMTKEETRTIQEETIHCQPPVISHALPVRRRILCMPGLLVWRLPCPHHRRRTEFRILIGICAKEGTPLGYPKSYPSGMARSSVQLGRLGHSVDDVSGFEEEWWRLICRLLSRFI
jgi:hypothetical protein